MQVSEVVVVVGVSRSFSRRSIDRSGRALSGRLRVDTSVCALLPCSEATNVTLECHADREREAILALFQNRIGLLKLLLLLLLLYVSITSFARISDDCQRGADIRALVLRC